ALDAACACNARGLADDLWSCAAVAAWVRSEWKPDPLSLDCHLRVLPALPRYHWLGVDLSASLLAFAAPDGCTVAKHFAHYSTRSRHARMVVRRRNVSAFFLVRRGFGPCRRMDDFPKSGCVGTADSGRLRATTFPRYFSCYRAYRWWNNSRIRA